MGFEHTSDWQVYTGRGQRKYLDADERRRFLAEAEDEPLPARALCLFLIYSGCRISEALNLCREQIDVTGNAVVLRTLKRRKIIFRRVPLPPFVIALLATMTDDGPLWTVHRATAWRWVARVMEKAEIDGPMACCRGTRHAFAMRAAAAKVPPNLLQRWMGHASLATTAIYLDAVGEDERSFAERMWS